MNIAEIYRELFDHFGPRGWWPGETAEEHLAGCVLAQNTRWDRVEPVIHRLKQRGVLTGSTIAELPLDELAELLKGSGTYRRKAMYLRGVWRHMLSSGWDGTAESVTGETAELRRGLLSLKGVGPETCDCILLYVLKRPVFVVDAYTKRILARHGLCGAGDTYHRVQSVFHDSLPRNVQLYNEYHALLVECGKQYCRPSPRCSGCPLEKGLP